MAKKPIVFIPGYPASELIQKSTGRVLFPPDPLDLIDGDKKRALVALLSDSGNEDIVAGEPIRDVLGIAKQAQSLYDILRQNRYGYTIHSGDNFRAVGWDWRKAVDDPGVQAAALDAIRQLRQANGGARVVVIAHSTGSLVLRRLLETQPEAVEGIERVLGFGATWAGNVFAIRSVVEGVSIGIWPAELAAGDVKKIVQSTQAAYDLFPPDPAPGKTKLVGRDGKPLNLFVDDTPAHAQLGPLVDLRWVPAGADGAAIRQHAADADRRLGKRTIQIVAAGGAPTPPITSVVGWGTSTDTSGVMNGQGKITIEESKVGDGTSAFVSASWLDGPGVRNVFLPIGIYPTNGIPTVHSRIWDAPPVLEILDQVLLDQPPAPFVCAAADSDEAIDSRSDVTVRISAADATGGALPDARVLLRGVSPTPLAFSGRLRMDARLPRTAIRPDAQRIFRFVAEVSWATPHGREVREVVVMFQT
jgi:pimeloyl-ACP methyl ester carboxylesterase